MAALLNEEDGLDYDRLLAAVNVTASQYRDLVEDAGLSIEKLESGAGIAPETMALLAPTILKGCLNLPSPEDLNTVKAFRNTQNNYDLDPIGRQDHLNDFTGDAVSKHVYGVANSAEIRSLLPYRTGLLIEVNSTLSYRGSSAPEDCHGMYGPRTSLLDYLVIDPEFIGLTLSLIHI